MTEAELLKLIQGGENIQVEFKKSTTEITKDVYDTVCSFSNRDGGIILLGVKDNGEILGVAPGAMNRMKKDFVTSINNGQKINPPLYLQPEVRIVEGRTLLVIQVPSGSQVCRHHGRIFDRSHESDIDITDNSDMVYQLYARKSGSYFVNKVTRFQMEDLRPDLIERARDRILREICSNSLAHRDFSSGYVAKFVIERNRFYTENADRSHGYGALHLSSFEPDAKNPPISKVFREIGPRGVTQVRTQVTLTDQILAFCAEPHSKAEIAEHCGYKNTKGFTKRYLRPLLDKGQLQMTIPDKPRSQHQKYMTVQKAAPEN